MTNKLRKCAIAAIIASAICIAAAALCFALIVPYNGVGAFDGNIGGAGVYASSDGDGQVDTVGGNHVRAADGTELLAIEKVFGKDGNYLPPRPEHGDTVTVAIASVESVQEPVTEFAVKYGDTGTVAYYEVKTVDGEKTADESKPISDPEHYKNTVNGFEVGSYLISVTVPEFSAEDTAPHKHWWLNNEETFDDLGVVYGKYLFEYGFGVTACDISDPANAFAWQFDDGEDLSIPYNGKDTAIPALTATLEGKELTEGEQFTVEADSLSVGSVSIVFRGIGNYSGEVAAPDAFNITIADNEWVLNPSVIYPWNYGKFVNGENGFTAEPKFLDDGCFVSYKVTRDIGGGDVVKDLENFVVDEDGTVSAPVEKELNALPVGTYYLTAELDASANYNAIEPHTIRFDIGVADNSWDVTPNIVQWKYGDYNKEFNIIDGRAHFSDDDHQVIFTVAYDTKCERPIEGLKDFTVTDGIVSDETAQKLGSLDVGVYFLVATVAESDNYSVLEPTAARFNVTQADNVWISTPVISSWTEGKYSTQNNKVMAQAKFGEVVVKIRNSDGTVVYDSATGLNKLANAEAGEYILTASVKGGENYYGLPDYNYGFRIFDAPGLAWWVVLLIVLGVVAVIAAVLLILWKAGVFSILTDKMALAIRTKATVDATIASVRAAKQAEEARQKQEQAKAEEIKQQKAAKRKAAALAKKGMSVEDKAAALEDKAKAANERAERIRARAEAMQARAERMRERVDGAKKTADAEQPLSERIPETEPQAEAAATESKTPTEDQPVGEK